MTKRSVTITIILFLLIIALVISLSLISGRLWGGKPETLPEPKELVINGKMSVGDFGRVNDLPNPVLKTIFGLKSRSDLQKMLSEYGTPDQIKSLVKKRLALAAEHATKNWVKILIKFGLWFAFLITLFIVFARRRLTPSLRKWVLFSQC